MALWNYVNGAVCSLLVEVLASTIINPPGPSNTLQKNYAQLLIQGIGVAAAVALEPGGTYVISRIVEFCRNILEPYEETFPRRKETSKEHNRVAENRLGMLLLFI
jgi:ammonia channel protein AmtB